MKIEGIKNGASNTTNKRKINKQLEKKNTCQNIKRW